MKHWLKALPTRRKHGRCQSHPPHPHPPPPNASYNLLRAVYQDFTREISSRSMKRPCNGRVRGGAIMSNERSTSPNLFIRQFGHPGAAACFLSYTIASFHEISILVRILVLNPIQGRTNENNLVKIDFLGNVYLCRTTVLWRLKNDVHTTKSRTRVILLSKCIGAF